MDPLHAAASQGDLGEVKKLLGPKPNLSVVDKKDKHNRTALFFAVRDGHREVAEYLLKLKANARAECSCCKTTALSKAAENGDVVLVEKLIRGGASLTQKNVNGDTPMALARRNGHDAARRKLKSIKQYKIEELSEAALHELTEFVGRSEGLRRLCGETDEDIKNTLEPKAKLAAKAALELAYGGVGPEITHNLTFLSLYDLILLIDDSWSMKFEEAGKRRETLDKVVKAVIKMYISVRDDDTPTTNGQNATSKGALAIRFLNSKDKFDNVVPDDLPRLNLLHRKYDGNSKIGTGLKKKVAAHFIPEDGDLKNPLLIMVLTDGAIQGEKKGLLEETIQDCATRVREKCGDRFLAFQFSRIGNDEDAKLFLKTLDRHPVVGKYVAVETAGLGFDEILNVRSDKRRERVIRTLTQAIKKDPDEDDEEENDGEGEDDGDDEDDN